MQKHYQVCVIGGGINGVGIAREAAVSGYSTLLLEKKDFGHCTSGNSSKLIHGGIRYLEHGEFRLVREALQERKILVNTAPHLVWPARINIPVYKGDKRPGFMIRIGSLLYDLFAGSKNLEGSKNIPRSQFFKYPSLLKEKLTSLIQYSDGQCLDSRLTLEIALDARTHGACIRNYHEVQKVSFDKTRYLLEVCDHRTGQVREVTCNFLVNAAGPWVPILDQDISRERLRPHLKYVRGIHFVIRNRISEEGFLILPADGRVIFVLPWVNNHTLIGTTESEYHSSDFDTIPPSEQEVEYLLENFNHFFPGTPIQLQDVVHTYSGVRSLLDSGDSSLSALTREYQIAEEYHGDTAGYLAIFGGKITTYRALAEKLVGKVKAHLKPRHKAFQSTKTLPIHGGVPIDQALDHKWESELRGVGLDEQVFNHWRKWYGSQWIEIARIAMQSEENREELLKPGYLRAEFLYNLNDELALCSEDILLRRTKLMYQVSEKEKRKLEELLKKHRDTWGIIDNTRA